MRALILVDLQYDFMPGGALAVARGDEVVKIARRMVPHFATVVATQDWHPPHHGSFASSHPGTKPYDLGTLGGVPQVMWPTHCVEGTHGAELHADLDRARVTEVFRKGTDPTLDSYSGFFDNGHKKATGLAEWLKARWIEQVYVLGLATDYCVKFTALDAKSLGFDVKLIEDGCRAVDLSPGDGDRAISELRGAGIAIVESGAIGA
ncbi:bifunctional nicotinamidase/pyrazinamidase [soil metagenome]